MNIDETQKKHYTLENESQTILFAQCLARAYQSCFSSHQGLVVYLKGDLGAGKSFFSRAFIQFFLPQQKVKSPTYTLVESYQAPFTAIHHFDLYRLGDPEELEYLAIRELLMEPFIALIEWPQKGEGVLPDADLLIELQHLNGLEQSNTESVHAFDAVLDSDARGVTFSADTARGGEIFKRILFEMSEK